VKLQRMICAVALSFMANLVFAQQSAIGNEFPAAEPAKDKSATTAAVAEAKDEKEALKPPPGFRAKKRGDKVLYCIKDSDVGTRFKTEKCYDEDKLRAYLPAREQNNRDFDQRRAICAACASQ